MDNNQLEFLDILEILSFIVGLQNLALNQKQVDGLMSEMTDHQNEMLRIIIKQNEQIIELLKEKHHAQNPNS